MQFTPEQREARDTEKRQSTEYLNRAAMDIIDVAPADRRAWVASHPDKTPPKTSLFSPDYRRPDMCSDFYAGIHASQVILDQLLIMVPRTVLGPYFRDLNPCQIANMEGIVYLHYNISSINRQIETIQQIMVAMTTQQDDHLRLSNLFFKIRETYQTYLKLSTNIEACAAGAPSVLTPFPEFGLGRAKVKEAIPQFYEKERSEVARAAMTIDVPDTPENAQLRMAANEAMTTLETKLKEIYDNLKTLNPGCFRIAGGTSKKRKSVRRRPKTAGKKRKSGGRKRKTVSMR